MFCKYCGKKITEDSIFCQYCGEKVGVVPENSEKPSTAFESDPEFVWDLHDFPGQKKTEDVDFSWRERQQMKKSQPTAPPPKTEPPRTESFDNQELPKGRGAGKAQEPSSPQKESLLEMINRDITQPREFPDSEQEEKIDRFYTFNKKNEEFQKLLDKEYERIRSGEIHNGNAAALMAQKKDPLLKKDSLEDLEDIILDNETLSRKFDTTEFKRDLIESALERAGAKGVIFEQPPTEKNLTGIPAHDDLTKDAPAAESGHTPASTSGEESKVDDREEVKEKDNKKVQYISDFTPDFIKASAPEHEEHAQGAQGAQGAHDEHGEKDESAGKAALDGLDHSKQEAFKALERLWDTGTAQVPQIPETPEAPKTTQAPDVPKTPNFPEAPKDSQIPEAPKEPQTPQVPETPKVPEAPQTKGGGTDEVYQLSSENGTIKKNLIGKIILVIIIILLAIELSILAIRFLWPDSEAAAFVESKLKFAISWIGGDNDKEAPDAEDAVDTGNDADESYLPIDEPPDEPSTEPQADKAALVESQLSNNKNILKIEANEGLAYVKTKDYKVKDINDSHPIENNIWINENGEVVYYDQSVVAALIKFNSQWIDYVNEGDKSVLSLTKPGGLAEKNALNFSKVKAMTKTFNLFQIGEIRQGEQGFYVWTHEEISNDENGKVTESQHNWIYHVQPVENQMLIVSYYSF